MSKTEEARLTAADSMIIDDIAEHPRADAIAEAAVQDRRLPSPGRPASPLVETAGPLPMKILILQHEPADAEQLQRELLKGKLDFTARHVDTRESFIAALETSLSDIVLASDSVRGFDGAAVLAHVRHSHPEIPVVIVNGHGEERAIALLKAGATDYVLKDNLPRLSSAVELAIALEQEVRVRESAEQALHATNALLETVERIAHIGGYDWDIASGRVVWSKETYRMFGQTPGEFVPTISHFVDCVHPDDRGRVQDAIDASATLNKPFDLEFRIVRPDEAERNIHSLGEIVRDQNGKSLRMVGTSHDITERHLAEAAMQRLNRTLRTLSCGNEVLMRAGNEAELLNDMCRVIVETGGYRMAWVGVPQQDATKSVTPVASAGEARDYLDKVKITWADEPCGRGPHGRAIRSGEPQVTQRLRTDPTMAPWQEAANASGFSSSAVLPLKQASEIFAVLVIDSAEPDAFDADELRLLQELAGDIAFGIRSLRERTAHETLGKRWRESLEATIGAIAATVDLRDPYTAGHQQRVAKLAVAIARELQMPEHQIEGLYLAGIIHDVGKISIPQEILSNPGRLSKAQSELIREHAQAGYDILKGVDFPWPIAQIVLQHHERLDGSGYPQGLKGEAILPEAKILAVADVVEAMMSHRPYRAALGLEAALAAIAEGKDRIFDPAAVASCTELFRHNRFSFA